MTKSEMMEGGVENVVGVLQGRSLKSLCVLGPVTEAVVVLVLLEVYYSPLQASQVERGSHQGLEVLHENQRVQVEIDGQTVQVEHAADLNSRY
jgi:hypothetical protein